MDDSLRVFTVGSLECLIVRDDAAACEPESLYSDLPTEDTAPAVGALVNDQGLMRLPCHPAISDRVIW